MIQLVVQTLSQLRATSSPATVLATIRAGNVISINRMPLWKFAELRSTGAQINEVK